jgi:pyridoxine kinase
MNILSIQSHVAYGHVGNASAVFPMQRLGCEVWPIHTVQFSNHTGYGAWQGRVFDGPAIEEWWTASRSGASCPRATGCCRATWGRADIGTAILGAVARVREANPRALYCCDPVIGDVGRGVFVRPGIPEFMRDQAVPAADIVTPNQFELDYLSGITTASLASAKEAVAAVHLMGPRVVLVTSLDTDETPGDAIDLLAGEPVLAGAHAAARALGQRGGRRDRGPVLRPLRPRPLRRDRARRGGGLSLRPPQAHRGGGVAGDPHGRGPGRVRAADPPLSVEPV